jgi:hypothetical protein
MRALTWFLVAVGILAVIGIAALIGNRDKTGETVSAGEWAQSVCGSVGVWRGQIEAIVDEVRNAPSRGSLGVEEPQSETDQGRRIFVRGGLELAVGATQTLVDTLDDAGIPDTPNGEEAVNQLTGWADSAHDELDEAEQSLEAEADTLEEAVTQLTTAVESLGSVLASGVLTLAEIARTDPELAVALRDASTCRHLRGEVQR